MAARVPPALLAVHRSNNEATAGAWETFAGHRQQVTALIARGGGRLLVLGAGNGNDLDFAALASRFTEVHLVDLDDRALARAAERAQAAGLKPVLHGGVDVTGALSLLPEWRTRAPSAGELENLAALRIARVMEAMPGPFDTVVSSCLLSQIMHTAFRALGGGNRFLRGVATALLVGHVRLLVQLTAPGGTGLLISDVASSDDLDVEGALASGDGRTLLAELVARGGTMNGTDPALIRRILAEDAVAAPLVDDSQVEPPWAWRISDAVTYLVTAVQFRRRSAG